MTSSTLKKLTYLFWTSVGGIVVTLAGTIYTAAHAPKPVVETAPKSIPVPAEAPRQ